MKFDDLDKKMRRFETSHDVCVPLDCYMVARIDGRNFTRLTKEVHQFNAPFDERFGDYMLGTTEHLMTCGFRVIYGYVQSDEISLLFHHSETTFSRKLRKYNSILAGEASAKFSLLLGDVACFDCRISELPSPQDVRDYFRWRNEDAARNALSAYCYWTLRKTGCSVSEATGTTTKMSTPEKHALLSKFDIDFDTVPQWQKRGTGLVWKSVPVAGRNPITSEDVQTERRRLMRELDLPVGDDYGDFVMQILNQNNDIQKSL